MAVRVLGSRGIYTGLGAYRLALEGAGAGDWEADIAGQEEAMIQDILPTQVSASTTDFSVHPFSTEAADSAVAFKDVPDAAVVSEIRMGVLQRLTGTGGTVEGEFQVNGNVLDVFDFTPAAGFAIATITFPNPGLTGAQLKAASFQFQVNEDVSDPRLAEVREFAIRVTFSPVTSFPIILDSNQPALMTCRAGVGRAGVMRASAAFGDLRNLTDDGLNAWTRTRAINPAHNAVPQSASWTVFRRN